MDIATLVGILGAFGIVIVAILIGGDTSPLIFLTPPLTAHRHRRYLHGGDDEIQPETIYRCFQSGL
jgi:hypothetical protein